MRLDGRRPVQILDGPPRLPQFRGMPDSGNDVGLIVMTGLSGILGTKDSSKRLGGLGVVQGRPKRFKAVLRSARTVPTSQRHSNVATDRPTPNPRHWSTPASPLQESK
jgi:hypothetical protein